MAIIESEFLDLTRDLDLAAFRTENKQRLGFTTDKPCCAVSFSPDDHWIFEFMAVPWNGYDHDTGTQSTGGDLLDDRLPRVDGALP
jgi:hypothetical protein